MQDIWVPIIVAIITSGILTALGKKAFDWARGKHKQEDDAWKQRDTHRRRADRLHEALRTHRTWCHKQHEAAFEDMPAFPGD